MAIFYPIFKEKNDQKIYRFYKDKHIRFVIIRDYADSKNRLKQLMQTTKLFDFLDNPKYAKLVINSDQNVYWRVYEIL